MSVSATVTLPATPSTGVLTYVPLGGNGYTSPFAMWSLANFLVTGAAGGGSQSLSVVMDDRYCSLMSYASMTYTDTAAHDYRWSLVGEVGGPVPLDSRTLKITASSASINAATQTDVWRPTPVVHPGATPITLSVATLNVDTFVLQLHLQVFLFNINARQKVPYHLLVACRPGDSNSGDLGS